MSSKKMEILVTNRQALTWLWMHPIDEDATKWQKTVNLVFSLLVFVIHLCSMMSAATFIFKNVSFDMEESLYAILQTVASSACFYVMIIGFYSRRKMLAIFRGLSKIVDICKNSLL